MAALAALLPGAAAARQRPAPSPLHRPDWREAPEYLRPFAPAGPRARAYRILVTPDDLETALGRLNLDPALPGGIWTPRSVAPLDAFGLAGAFDRSTVARLYGSTRARVARGTVVIDGVREFWTLISPHPDAILRRLDPGTLLLVLRYDRGDSTR